MSARELASRTVLINHRAQVSQVKTQLKFYVIQIALVLLLPGNKGLSGGMGYVMGVDRSKRSVHCRSWLCSKS